MWCSSSSGEEVSGAASLRSVSPVSDSGRVFRPRGAAGPDVRVPVWDVRGPPELAHVEWSTQQAHPFRGGPRDVPGSLQAAVEWLGSASAAEVTSFRKQQFKFVKELAQRFPSQGPGVNAGLLAELCRVTGFSDPGAAECCSGAVLHGEQGGPDEWPVHPATEAEQDPWPVERAWRRHVQDRPAFLRSVRPSPHDRDLWEASMEDVNLGRMSGPFSSLDEVAEVVGPEFFVSRRFGVDQGGNVRPCDDFLRSYLNRTVWCSRKLKLPQVDDFCALASACFAAGLTPQFWKVDHEAAYRQIPLRPDQRRLAVVVFCDPVSGERRFWIHRSLPFGALAAVYAYNRPARALVHIARTLFRIPVDSFFDDFGGG